MSNKKYPPSVGFWPTKNGNGYTTLIDSRLVDLVNNNVGARLFLTDVPEERRALGEKVPHKEIIIFSEESRS